MGYRRIHGELAGLGVKGEPRSKDSGVDGMGDPEETGIGPAPRRTAPAWSQFLRSQAEAILASGVFAVDLLDGTEAYVLAVIEHATRRVRIPVVTRIRPAHGPPSRHAT